MKKVTNVLAIVIGLLLAIVLFTGCGQQGDVGSNGRIGAIGPAGPKGDVGAPGQDVTPVTVVSFCGGPSVYPSNFPEYGLVIGGQVFGVYSTNGGFLALLPPGVYSSNAVGSSCTFTINADATVSR